MKNGFNSKKLNPSNSCLHKILDTVIENFIEKNNTELFPILEKYNRKLALYSFYVLIIGGVFNAVDTFLLSIIFFVLLFTCIPLLKPRDFKKAFIRFMKEFFAFIVIAISFLLMLKYLETYLPVKFQNLNRLMFEVYNEAFQINKYPISVFIIATLILFVLAIVFIIILYWISRAVLWYMLVPLVRLYSKFCKWLNEEQPLKPFYLLSKTIIVFVIYFVTS